MKLYRLGREHRFKEAAVAGEPAQKRKVGVIADGEDVGVRWMCGLLPESGIADGDLCADDGLASIGASVREEGDRGLGLRGLGEGGGQGFEQVRAAAKLARTHKVQRLLDGDRRCGDRLRLEGRDLLVEEQ